MKRPVILVAVGLLVALAGYGGFYFGTAAHRGLLRSPSAELLWLKKEFDLTDAELSRIARLHEAYRPLCNEMCRRIDEQNAKLKRLLASANGVTPEVEQCLAEAAQLRGECHRDMLRHFFAVSQMMPPEQGERYLDWILPRTVLMPAPLLEARWKRIPVRHLVGYEQPNMTNVEKNENDNDSIRSWSRGAGCRGSSPRTMWHDQSRCRLLRVCPGSRSASAKCGSKRRRAFRRASNRTG